MIAGGFSRGGLAIALAVCLSSCSASSGLDEWNDAKAATEIAGLLQSKGFNFGEQHFCSEWFEIEAPKILDVTLPGGSGMASGVMVEVKASTPIRAKESVVAGSRIAELCYGWPDGGWSAGQTSNYLHTFTFKRWRSGWHIVNAPGS